VQSIAGVCTSIGRLELASRVEIGCPASVQVDVTGEPTDYYEFLARPLSRHSVFAVRS